MKSTILFLAFFVFTAPVWAEEPKAQIPPNPLEIKGQLLQQQWDRCNAQAAEMGTQLVLLSGQVKELEEGKKEGEEKLKEAEKMVTELGGQVRALQASREAKHEHE